MYAVKLTVNNNGLQCIADTCVHRGTCVFALGRVPGTAKFAPSLTTCIESDRPVMVCREFKGAYEKVAP